VKNRPAFFSSFPVRPSAQIEGISPRRTDRHREEASCSLPFCFPASQLERWISSPYLLDSPSSFIPGYLVHEKKNEASFFRALFIPSPLEKVAFPSSIAGSLFSFSQSHNVKPVFFSIPPRTPVFFPLRRETADASCIPPFLSARKNDEFCEVKGSAFLFPFFMVSTLERRSVPVSFSVPLWRRERAWIVSGKGGGSDRRLSLSFR